MHADAYKPNYMNLVFWKPIALNSVLLQSGKNADSITQHSTILDIFSLRRQLIVCD